MEIKTTSQIWHEYNKVLDVPLKKAVEYLDKEDKDLPNTKKWVSVESLMDFLSKGDINRDAENMIILLKSELLKRSLNG